MRKAVVERTTKETRVTAEVNLDGTGKYQVGTGIGFLDICWSSCPGTR